MHHDGKNNFIHSWKFEYSFIFIGFVALNQGKFSKLYEISAPQQ